MRTFTEAEEEAAERRREYGLTKHGGYESIPQIVIERAARRVGVKSPPVKVTEDKHIVAPMYKTKERVIVIPRFMHKAQVEGSLRHELQHYKQQLKGDTNLSSENWLRREIEVDRKENTVSSTRYALRIMWLAGDERYGRKGAIRIFKTVAKAQGISDKMITNSIYTARQGWKANIKVE